MTEHQHDHQHDHHHVQHNDHDDDAPQPHLEVRWPKNPNVAPPITPPAEIEIKAIVARAFLVVMMVMMIRMVMIVMFLSPLCTEPPKKANRSGIDAGSD